MDILKPDTSHLRNEEHYQLGGEFNEIAGTTGVAALKIQPQYGVWASCYHVEGLALKKIIKSAYTGQITEAAAKRDQTFRGLVDTNRAMLNHFDTQRKDAAARLQIVFDTYGNIAGKSLTEKTGSYDNLIAELRSTTCIETVKSLNFTEWVDALEGNNKEVFRLMQLRNDEAAGKTSLSVKEARRHADEAYDRIMQRIGALLLIEGEENAEQKALYETFIRKHNAAVARYNNAIASRRGRAGENAELASTTVPEADSEPEADE